MLLHFVKSLSDHLFFINFFLLSAMPIIPTLYRLAFLQVHNKGLLYYNFQNMFCLKDKFKSLKEKQLIV